MNGALPLDPQFEILLRSDPQTVVNYCQTSRQSAQLCQSPYFMTQYFILFGLSPEQLPGNPLEKLTILAELNWDLISGNSIQQKERFVSGILQLIDQGDYRGALAAAVRTGSPLFVRLILDRIRTSMNVDDFRDIFLLAVTMSSRYPSPAWSRIIQLFLHYYDPRQDPFMLDTRHGFVAAYAYYNAIRQADFELVKAFAQYIPTDEAAFWTALQLSQPEIATYFRDRLLQRGVDPLSGRQETIYDLYMDAINNNDTRTFLTLTRFVPPSHYLRGLIKLAWRNAPVQVMNSFQ